MVEVGQLQREGTQPAQHSSAPDRWVVGPVQLGNRHTQALRHSQTHAAGPDVEAQAGPPAPQGFKAGGSGAVVSVAGSVVGSVVAVMAVVAVVLVHFPLWLCCSVVCAVLA
jgi:hypothetical protein